MGSPSKPLAVPLPSIATRASLTRASAKHSYPDQFLRRFAAQKKYIEKSYIILDFPMVGSSFDICIELGGRSEIVLVARYTVGLRSKNFYVVERGFIAFYRQHKHYELRTLSWIPNP